MGPCAFRNITRTHAHRMCVHTHTPYVYVGLNEKVECVLYVQKLLRIVTLQH